MLLIVLFILVVKSLLHCFTASLREFRHWIRLWIRLWLWLWWYWVEGRLRVTVTTRDR
jgi:hypothetical protein